jgi:hypothetical protein
MVAGEETIETVVDAGGVGRKQPREAGGYYVNQKNKHKEIKRIFHGEPAGQEAGHFCIRRPP